MKAELFLHPGLDITLHTKNSYKYVTPGDENGTDPWYFSGITVSVELSAVLLDNSGQVCDRRVLYPLADFTEMFNRATLVWDKAQAFAAGVDEPVVILPLNPTLEQLSRVLFMAYSNILSRTDLTNAEDPQLELHAVTLSVPDHGKITCYSTDARSPGTGGGVNLNALKFLEHCGADCAIDWRRHLNSQDRFSTPEVLQEVDPYA